MSDPRAKPGIHPTTEDVTKRGRGITLAWILFGVLMAAVVVAFAFSLTRPSGSVVSSGSNYVQSWPKDYASTTCSDWLDEMSTEQQSAASADILSAARDKIDGGSGVAPDDLIEEFRAGITNVCVIPTMTITDATYGLYTSEPKFHP